jgi:hypothetical protein
MCPPFKPARHAIDRLGVNPKLIEQIYRERESNCATALQVDQRAAMIVGHGSDADGLGKTSFELLQSLMMSRITPSTQFTAIDTASSLIFAPVRVRSPWLAQPC